MLERRLIMIHWVCFLCVVVLISATIIGVIANTVPESNHDNISIQMIDEAALKVILYFSLLPIYTIIHRLIARSWVFFPWQHNKGNK